MRAAVSHSRPDDFVPVLAALLKPPRAHLAHLVSVINSGRPIGFEKRVWSCPAPPLHTPFSCPSTLLLACNRVPPALPLPTTTQSLCPASTSTDEYPSTPLYPTPPHYTTPHCTTPHYTTAFSTTHSHTHTHTHTLTLTHATQLIYANCSTVTTNCTATANLLLSLSLSPSPSLLGGSASFCASVAFHPFPNSHVTFKPAPFPLVPHPASPKTEDQSLVATLQLTLAVHSLPAPKHPPPFSRYHTHTHTFPRPLPPPSLPPNWTRPVSWGNHIIFAATL